MVSPFSIRSGWRNVSSLLVFTISYVRQHVNIVDIVEAAPNNALRDNPNNDESVARLEKITENMHGDGLSEAAALASEAFGGAEDPYASLGVDPDEASYDPHRMPLGGMTNLHHPTSCSRKKNVHKRWLEARLIVEDFLDQPYGEAARLGMIGGRWNVSNCDCTCGACHTFLQECPIGHLLFKWMSFFGTTPAFRALLVLGNVVSKTDDSIRKNAEKTRQKMLMAGGGFAESILKKGDDKGEAKEGEAGSSSEGADEASDGTAKQLNQDDEAVRMFDVLDNYGSNILFMIRGNWGSFYLLQSGWPIPDILLRLRQQMLRDGYELIPYLRSKTPDRVEKETQSALKESLIIAEIHHFNSPHLMNFAKPTWFSCFPLNDFSVEREVIVLKWNLRLRNYRTVLFGWYDTMIPLAERGNTDEVEGGSALYYWIEAAKQELGIDVVAMAAEEVRRKLQSGGLQSGGGVGQPGGKVGETATGGADASGSSGFKDIELCSPVSGVAPADCPPSSGTGSTSSPEPSLIDIANTLKNLPEHIRERLYFGNHTRNQASRVQYRWKTEWLPRARAALSRDLLDFRNYTHHSPIPTHFDHNMNLLSANPFAKRVLDLEARTGSFEQKVSILNFRDGPRVVNDPGDFSWKINSERDRRGLPGLVEIWDEMSKRNLTTKFFDPKDGFHFQRRADAVSAAREGRAAYRRKHRLDINDLEEEERKGREKTQDQQGSAKTSEEDEEQDMDIVSGKSLYDMQEAIKTGTKYLMPSCSLQQAAAIAEHIVEDILEVDVDSIDVHGNNIFRTPMMNDEPEYDSGDTTKNSAEEKRKNFCRLEEHEKIPPEEGGERIYEGGVEVKASWVDGFSQTEPVDEDSPNPDGEYSELSWAFYRNGTEHELRRRRRFKEIFGYPKSRWDRAKVKIPFWTDVIKKRFEGRKHVYLPTDRLERVKKRFEGYIRTQLTEIDMLLHMWAGWQRKGFFGALVVLPEGARLLKGLAVIQASLIQEYFCKRVFDSAVAFQGEWQIETNVIDLFATGLGLDFSDESADIRRNLGVNGEKDVTKEAEKTPDAEKHNEDSAAKDQPILSPDPPTPHRFPLAAHVAPPKKLAKTLSTRFAFVGEIFANKNVKTYIRALRTVARSVFRNHYGKYRFLVLAPAELPVEVERDLTRAPGYNLEVRRVYAHEVAANPNFGYTKEQWNASASIEWWRERGTPPTSVGFYRWALTEFERVVFIDADCLVLRPVDELFQVSPPLAVGITPFATFRLFDGFNRFPYINIGVMVVTPSKEMHDIITKAAEDPDSFGGSTSRYWDLFEAGPHQPWLDHLLLRTQVRAGYVRFEPTGTENQVARTYRRDFYHGLHRRGWLMEQGYSKEEAEKIVPPPPDAKEDELYVDGGGTLSGQINPDGSLAGRIPPDGSAVPKSVAEEMDLDDRTDSNEVPLTFVGCDESFASRWEHGRILSRGTLLQPGTTIMTYHKFGEQDKPMLNDANSLQRVYFSQDMSAHGQDAIRASLDRQVEVYWEGK